MEGRAREPWNEGNKNGEPIFSRRQAGGPVFSREPAAPSESCGRQALSFDFGSGPSWAASNGSTAAAPTTGTASALIEAALPLIRTGASVATGAVLDFAVQQSNTRTRLANEMYAAASAVYSLSGGTFPTTAQFQANILAFGGSQTDASYAQFATAISSLYASYYPKLASGNAKTATDLLNAIAGGIEDATAAYVTVPVSSTAVASVAP
jgi:hypothetical protein